MAWNPKDYEKRTVPLPSHVVKALQKRRKAHPGDFLVFPNKNTGRPEGHFLRMLQDLAFKAGLNCGHCESRNGKSCKTHAVCDRFGLHKFRKTFATRLHQAGIDARTVQLYLGHSDLKTTLAYLKGLDATSEATRAKVQAAMRVFA